MIQPYPLPQSSALHSTQLSPSQPSTVQQSTPKQVSIGNPYLNSLHPVLDSGVENPPLVPTTPGASGTLETSGTFDSPNQPYSTSDFNQSQSEYKTSLQPFTPQQGWSPYTNPNPRQFSTSVFTSTPRTLDPPLTSTPWTLDPPPSTEIFEQNPAKDDRKSPDVSQPSRFPTVSLSCDAENSPTRTPSFSVPTTRLRTVQATHRMLTQPSGNQFVSSHVFSSNQGTLNPSSGNQLGTNTSSRNHFIASPSDYQSVASSSSGNQFVANTSSGNQFVASPFSGNQFVTNTYSRNQLGDNNSSENQFVASFSPGHQFVASSSPGHQFAANTSSVHKFVASPFSQSHFVTNLSTEDYRASSSSVPNLDQGLRNLSLRSGATIQDRETILSSVVQTRTISRHALPQYLAPPKPNLKLGNPDREEIKVIHFGVV